MSEKEMLHQLQDLICDRRSFLTDDKESSKPFRKDIVALEKIIHDYTILRDAAYRSMEDKGENLKIWVNENVLSKKVDVLSVWKSDYDDIRVNAIFYKNKKQVGNFIISLDDREIQRMIQVIYHKETIDNKLLHIPIKTMMYDSFDEYLKLPKLSKCSKLLQEIYDNVCESDATMCHITEADWRDYYSGEYTEKDFEKLKEEVKKYNLEEIIVINDGEYKIVAYGNLETTFNDDRSLQQEKSNLVR